MYYSLRAGCSGVFKINTDGSGSALLGYGFNDAMLFGLDAGHVYFTASDGLYRVNR